MSVETTKAVVSKYLDSGHTDLSMMAEDVVFTNMASGDVTHGPANLKEMLNYIYHVAFDAKAETKSCIYTESSAVFEADFVGKHIGEFAGVPATNKDVRIPLCVVYDLEGDKIKRARIYFEVPVFFKQVNGQ
jgi:steroid delta-isomerase-like uncharacterized protein